jgi:hypothetical protein
VSRRRQLGPAVPSTDLNGALHVLRDNLAKADAFITAAEPLIEQSWGDSGDEGDEDDDSVLRRRLHAEHLVESAKLAVRAAAYTGQDLEALAKRWRGA